ncbi:TPA: tetratricopeptide repeat protein [Candidatus Poribacteria bacterium]|nr:tetratricopeptide repeat protein [Candidatus Poribacteria bacterium]HIM12030.1 tetratricopeptide repeat protein [Candidatus Poribacteria bacterium]
MSYKQAILINPDYVEAYLNLGAVYRTAGKL